MKKVRLEIAAPALGAFGALTFPLAWLALMFAWMLFHGGDPGPFMSEKDTGGGVGLGIAAGVGVAVGAACGFEARRMAREETRAAWRRSFWWCGLLTSSIVLAGELVLLALAAADPAGDLVGAIAMGAATLVFTAGAIAGAYLRERVA